MVQGLFGGTTYENQSLKQIQDDIESWFNFSISINHFFQRTLDKLESNEYTYKIPLNLLLLFRNTVQTSKAFMDDLQAIKINISNSHISPTDVRLLKNIGKVSSSSHREYGFIYHAEVEWREYDNPDFRLTEKLYQEGRSYFLTLDDAQNAAKRLEDYVNTESSRNTLIVNGTGNNIQQGSGNRMTVNIEHNPTSIDRAEANRLLTQFLDKLDEYFSEGQEQERDDAKDYIEVIQDQIVKEDPKNSMLKTALKGLVALNGSAGFASSVLTISQFFGFTPK